MLIRAMSDIKTYKNLFKIEKEHEIVRVDHAGELGAKYIYLGQLQALKNDNQILEMLEGELIHLQYFEDKIKQEGIRPSALNPIWRPCAFLLGFLTAKLGGRRFAMLCTEKVEEVISEHYAEQIDLLEESNFKQVLIKFRNDEIMHLNTGKNEGLKNEITGKLISFFTKTAIKLSKII